MDGGDGVLYAKLPILVSISLLFCYLTMQAKGARQRKKVFFVCIFFFIVFCFVAGNKLAMEFDAKLWHRVYIICQLYIYTQRVSNRTDNGKWTDTTYYLGVDYFRIDLMLIGSQCVCVCVVDLILASHSDPVSINTDLMALWHMLRLPFYLSLREHILERET